MKQAANWLGLRELVVKRHSMLRRQHVDGELIALGQDQAGIGSRPAANTIRTETGCNLRACQSKTTKQYHLLAGQVRGNGPRFARRRRCCAVLQIQGMDEMDRVSTLRISLVRDLESGPAISRKPSRNAGASCRSRQVLHAASVKIGPNFIQNRAEPSVFIEIFIDLPVPRRTISLTQKRDQFRELFRRKLINRSFDFG